MAYRIVEGVPGSGKSYYIVDWLALRSGFCLELKDGGYVLDPTKKIRVITNVAGLQIPHEDFQTALDQAGGFEIFFTKDYQRDFSGDSHLIYILDEAQEWFHPQLGEKWGKENLAYFTWARHEGHDVFLLTQNTSLLRRDVVFLAEYIVHAQPRVNNISSELTYVYRTIDGTEIRIQRLLFSKKVAALYRSSEKGETIKIKNYRFRKYLAALGFAFILMFFGMRSSYKYWDKFVANPGVSPEVTADVAVVKPSGNPSGNSSPNSSRPKENNQSSSASLESSVSSGRQQVEFFMSLVDYASFSGKTLFLLGNTWLSESDYPYRLLKTGNSYYALVPGLLVNSKSPQFIPLKEKVESYKEWEILGKSDNKSNKPKLRHVFSNDSAAAAALSSGPRPDHRPLPDPGR